MVILALLVITALQNAVAGYTINVGLDAPMSSGMSSMCAADAALPSDKDCCKHHSRHSMPLSCLAHCAATVALVPAV